MEEFNRIFKDFRKKLEAGQKTNMASSVLSGQSSDVGIKSVHLKDKVMVYISTA